MADGTTGTYREAEAEFTVEPDMTITPTSGSIGDTVSVSGTGFGKRKSITITYDGDEPPLVVTVTADSSGAFQYTLIVPPSRYGAHNITVTDGTNTKPLTFTMESTPPSPVYPQLPLMDSKLEAWRFDWCGDATDLTKEVTDDSLPVTYTLQIASDASFSVIVLEKEGLTTSEYTLTEAEEKLVSASSEKAPYYWRVKAIDAASNETAWTGTGTFYVGFAWPDWIIYLWFGLGILAAGVLGFWLGRRTTYY